MNNCCAFNYGVGTYIQKILKFLNQIDCNVTLIYFNNEVFTLTIRVNNMYRIIEIPSLEFENKEKYSNRFLKYISYLLRFYINKEEDNIFHFNFYEHLELAKMLKIHYKYCHILFSVHYLNWLINVKGDMRKLHGILTSDKDPKTPFEQKIFYDYHQNMCFFNLADKIICLSKYTQSLLNKYSQIDLNKLEIVYNGCELNTNKIDNKCSLALKSKYLIDSKEKVVLFVGRLVCAKGVDYLIDAFKIVLESCQNVRLLIVGDGNYNLCLEKSINIWSKVTFTGKVSQKILFELYQLADVGVLPSFCEQCSYTAIEMIMNGLPFISTSSTGIKEMMIGNIENIVELSYDNDDVCVPIDELAQKIILNLNSPKKKNLSFQSKYSLECMRTKIIYLYKNL